jgi:hypothetical protein
MTDHHTEIAKLLVSIVGLVGTFVAAFVAVRTYIRTERRKKAEFLAREMKEFFAKERVQNALTLIDWGTRDMKLLDESAKNDGRVLITRQKQLRALLPHSLQIVSSDEPVFHTGGEVSDPEHLDDSMRRYSPAEAAIRDCYDAFLDGLDTFASYVKTRLIEIDDLRPYLQYWIDDLHGPAANPNDAAWLAALATFIAVYRFNGVQWLFKAFDRDISPRSEAFQSFISMMIDKELAKELKKIAESTEQISQPQVHEQVGS